MIPLTFGDIETWGAVRLHRVNPLDAVAGVSIDSREAGPGTLFVALPGRFADGHQFVREVWAKGGVALVREDFEDDGGPLLLAESPLEAMGWTMRGCIEHRGIRVVGVTGSAGKTSIKELTRQALSAKYATGMTQNNYNTNIGLPLSFFASPTDITHFVAEMAMRGRGEIRHLTTIAPPDIAVISNIGMSHLEKLGSMEAIQAAKGEILEGLKEGGTAVLNFEDFRVRELGERLSGRKTVWWYGTSAHLDAVIEAVAPGLDHLVVDLSVLGERVRVRLPWLGEHQAFNVAAALLVAARLGVDPRDAADALSAIDPGRSRIVREKVGSLWLIADVYNASPDSMAGSLKVLAGQPGRKVAVLGDMFELGSGELEGHRRVGEIAAETADLLVAVGTRARIMASAAAARGLPVRTVDDLGNAEAALKAVLLPDDVVLFKASRGMAFETLVERIRVWGGPT